MSWWSKKVKKYAGTALGVVGGALLGAVTGGAGWALAGKILAGSLIGGSQGYSSDKQKEMAKEAQAEQRRQIAEQDALAKAERKRKIDSDIIGGIDFD